VADNLLWECKYHFMKQIKLLTAALAVLLFTATKSDAQIQLSAFGSYLKGTGDNTNSIYGGGLAGKFFVGNNVALGAGVRSYPKRTSKYNHGAYEITDGDYLTNVAGSLDFILGSKKSMIQPFIGTDAGISIANHTTTYYYSSEQRVINNNKSFFLLSPKAGLNIGLGQAFGIFAQAQYNLTFGSGDNVDISNIPGLSDITSKPIDKYFSFDAGIYIRLSAAK